MASKLKRAKEQDAEVEWLRARLEEVEETLQAIRRGAVDALMVAGPQGDQLYTLAGAAEPYRVLIEQMNQGAATLSIDGLILYCNRHFAGLLRIPLEQVIGSSFYNFISQPDRKKLAALLQTGHGISRSDELTLQTAGAQVSLRLAVNGLPPDTAAAICMIATDLTEDRNRRIALLNMMEDLVAAKKELVTTNRVLGREIYERQEIQDALEKTHLRLRKFVDANIVGVLIADATGKVKEANDYYLRMIGVSREEFEQGNINWRAITPAEWLPADENALRELRETGTCAPYEKEYVRPDGKRVAVFLADAMLPGTEGEIAAFALDITERKRMETAVKFLQQRLHQVFEMLPAYVILLSPDYHVPFANRFFRERFGESRGKRCYEYLFNRDSPCDNCETFKVLKTHAPHHWEWTGPDGRNYDIHDFPFTDADGSPLIMEMGIDITKRKQAEAEIRKLNVELEQRVADRTRELNRRVAELQTIFETVPVGLAIAEDPAGSRIRGNPAIERLTGVGGAGELSLTSQQPPPYRARGAGGRELPPSELPMQRACRGETVADWIMEIERPNGEISILQSNARPLCDENGKLVGAVGAFMDITRIKLAETALRESEELRRAVMDNSPDAIYVKDRQSRWLIGNPEVLRIVGKTAAQAAGKTDLELYDDPAIGRSILENDRRIMQNGKAETFEEIADTPEGRRIFQSTKAPRRDIQGNIIGLVGISRDITDRKQAEEALRESEERMQQALRASHSFTFEWKPAIDQVRRSASCAAILGLSGDAVCNDTGQRYFQRIHPDDRVRFIQMLQELTPAANSYTTEYRVRRDDGNLAVVEEAGQASFDPEGKLARLIGVTTDITSRKQVEEALRQSEERFKAIASCTPDHVLVQDRDLRYEMVINPQIELSEKDMIGRTDHDFLRPDEADHLTRIKRQVLETRRPVHLEAPLVAKSGEKRFFDGSYVPRFDAEGQVNGLIGYFRDVTDRKHAEEKIEKLNTELEQRAIQLEAANKELESFSYSVSHDLRAPLRAIDGFSRILLEDFGWKLDKEAQEHLHRVRTATQRMGQLIDDLLLLSRATRREMRHGTVNLSSIAAEIAGELKRSGPERQVEFTIQPDLMAQGDPNLLRIVLENLLGNAWKFTSKEPAATIEFSLVPDDAGQAFCVRDNGAGFDPTYASKLFGAFQRLHAPDEFPGTGIGLATVQRIIHRHGGRIWAEGAVGEGAAFYFTLSEERKSS